MSDIFISYASQDRDVAQRLAAALDSAGHRTWWDRTIPPGRVFDEVIQEALTAARCVVVLWSGHSVRSNWVKVEAEEAMARGCLVPVLIEHVTPPIQFKRVQAADLSGWDGDVAHPEFRNLQTSIDRLMSRTASPPPLAAAAVARSRPASGPSPLMLTAGAVAIALLSIAATMFFLRDGEPAVDSTTTAAQPRTADAAAERHASAPSQASAGPSQPARAGDAPGRATTIAAGPPREHINVVAPEHGGELLVATDMTWADSVDGKEDTGLWSSLGGESEAVFGFRDGRSATFDRLEILIPHTSANNVAAFELLVGNSQDGPFEQVIVAKTQNVLLVKERFQKFPFAPRTARFVKVRSLGSHGRSYSTVLSEWRLLGSLD